MDFLQDWCEQCVFGSKSEVGNTEGLSVEVRVEISQQQEDELIKALHEVLGLPLSERLQKEKEQKKVNRRKAELQILQRIRY